MKVPLIVASLFLGFVGFMLDGNFSPEMPLFTIVLFLLPTIWAVGAMYDEMPSMIAEELSKNQNSEEV